MCQAALLAVLLSLPQILFVLVVVSVLLSAQEGRTREVEGVPGVLGVLEEAREVRAVLEVQAARVALVVRAAVQVGVYHLVVEVERLVVCSKLVAVVAVFQEGVLQVEVGALLVGEAVLLLAFLVGEAVPVQVSEGGGQIFHLVAVVLVVVV
jgi:hypothetical protein